MTTTVGPSQRPACVTAVAAPVSPPWRWRCRRAAHGGPRAQLQRETPISAVTVLVAFGWVALVSRMRQHGTFRRQVTRFGQVPGKAVLAPCPAG
jgi:hypothetical protein